MDKKRQLRNFFLNYRNNMSQDQINRASVGMKNRFFKLKELEKAQRIMVYVSYRNEIRTYALIKRLLVENKGVFVPYCLQEDRRLEISPIYDLDTDLISGTYGIKEPKEKVNFPLEQLDIVLVPGVAFTRTGYRLGYGGGYYDRFIGRLSAKTLTIGLIYDALLVKTLPLDKYDLPVDLIITEKEVLYVGGDHN